MAFYQVWFSCDDEPADPPSLIDWSAMSPEEQQRETESASQAMGLWYYGVVEADSPDMALQIAESADHDEYPSPGA